MANRKDGAVRRNLATLFNLGAIGEWTDGQLLERFATGHDEAAELAFAALVERHGAMVMRVCRSRLADVNDAARCLPGDVPHSHEEFPALWVRDSLGPWLHQVAVRTARHSRKQDRNVAVSNSLRRFASLRMPPLPTSVPCSTRKSPGFPNASVFRLCSAIWKARRVNRLSRSMGRPVGTIKSWRARGRERLRQRLLRRGFAPSAGLALVFSADAVLAVVSPVLKARITAGTVSASVLTLMKGVLTTMLLGKLGDGHGRPDLELRHRRSRRRRPRRRGRARVRRTRSLRARSLVRKISDPEAPTYLFSF